MGSRIDKIDCLQRHPSRLCDTLRTQETFMPDQVAFFEIGGRHASELREFYKGLFGWKVEAFGQSAAGTDFFYVEPDLSAPLEKEG